MAKRLVDAPFLTRISAIPEEFDPDAFPFNRFPSLFNEDFRLEFDSPVTFFVGENGSGKSTMLEAIAQLCGFHRGGGSDWHQLHETAETEGSRLAKALRPSWLPKVSRGFFFRADTFADVARYLDEEGDIAVHQGRRLAHRSHGESLMAVFGDRFVVSERSMYLMDEPESALSPMRQLSFLSYLHEWVQSGNAQLIIATHSPIILSYPGADILLFDGERIIRTDYDDLEHVKVSRRFLDNPDNYLRHLLAEATEE